MKAIVIDSDSDILRLLNIKLKKSGYEVFAAMDGASGEELIREHNPELIVLETELGHKHGHELIRLAKKKNHKVLVIVLSAKNSEQDIIDGFNAGADDYMTKPFSPMMLLERIRIVSIRSSL
jgi:DNA-binding response OmpR family regulator